MEREVKEIAPPRANQYTDQERERVLTLMNAASKTFYGLAAMAGCHPFIEFNGLMAEFIKVCQEAHESGQDFPMASTHTGISLPFKHYHLEYLAEKLNCIYGPSLLSDKENRDAFIRVLFDGAFELKEVR